MSRGTPWRELWRTALRNIVAHRLRSFLTVLGIILGVFAVVMVVGIMESLELRLLKEFRADQGRVMQLSAWSPAVRENEVPFRRFEREQIQELREAVPQIQLISRRVGLGQKEARHQSRTRKIFVMGLDEHAFELMGLKLEAGRAFTGQDRLTGQPVAILGGDVARVLGLGPEHLGTSFVLGGQTAELVGLMPEPKGMMGGGMKDMVLVPFGSFAGLAAPGTFDSPSYTVMMDASLSQADAKAALETALRQIRGIRPGKPDDFSIRTNERIVEEIRTVKQVLMAAAGGMVGISLLVGGIGVMNIMLVTVAERTREIGVRKSMGARRRDVLLQFLMEAGLLCALGGAVGLLSGWLLSGLVGALVIKAAAGIPVWAIVTAVSVPAGFGLVFGLYPARKAAGLDPIEALRTE